MEGFSKQDIAKFMAYMREKQAEETVGTISATTVTGRPEPKAKAMPLQTNHDEELDFKLKSNFMIGERIRSLMSRSKFYEAVSLSEDMESMNELDIGLKLLIAECYIQLGRENKAEKTTREIEKILLKPPYCDLHDIISLAEDFGNNSNYIRALLLLRIASDIVVGDYSLPPDDKLSKIFSCIIKMDGVIDEMVKPPVASEEAQNILAIQRALTTDSIDISKVFGNKKKSSERTLALAFDYGVDVMKEMLEKMESIKDADQENKILKLARSANFISTHYDTNQFAKHVKILKYGIDLVEKHFKGNAAKYSIYGTMLKNLGVVFHNVEKYKEAEPIKVCAVEVLEHALDHASEEKKQQAIKSARESLRITRSHMKMA